MELYSCSELVLALSACYSVCSGYEISSDLPLGAGAETQERRAWDYTQTLCALLPHKAHWQVQGSGERCCIPLSGISALPSCPKGKCICLAAQKLGYCRIASCSQLQHFQHARSWSAFTNCKLKFTLSNLLSNHFCLPWNSDCKAGADLSRHDNLQGLTWHNTVTKLNLKLLLIVLALYEYSW